MCGEVKSKEKDKTDSRPLVTVTDLQNFKEEEALILRSRMRPFKTKLKFDHKIEWGMSKEKAEYPNAILNEVKIFDLKAFVEKKREEKINNMLSSGKDNNMGMPGPFGGMGGSPFGGMGGNPFMPSSNPFGNMGGNPFKDNSKNPFDSKSDSGFNVDDLVKRIDAKIAELEEEERKENEEKNNSLDNSIDIDIDSDKDNSTLEIKDDDNVVDAIIDNDRETITDDQFFDDFFSDE